MPFTFDDLLSAIDEALSDSVDILDSGAPTVVEAYQRGRISALSYVKLMLDAYGESEDEEFPDPNVMVEAARNVANLWFEMGIIASPLKKDQKENS